MSDLSDCIYLKDSRVHVSKNNANWYRVVLSYEHSHPEANFYLARELEKRKKYEDAYKHYRQAYHGGYNSAILGLSRIEKIQNDNKIEPKTETKKFMPLGFLPIILLFFLLASIIIYYIFNPLYLKEKYKVFNIKEVEQSITEKNILLHRIPIKKYFSPTLFDDNNYVALKTSPDSSISDVLINADQFIEGKNIDDMNLIFYYPEDFRDENIRGYAVAKVDYHKDKGITDIYIYPNFKKKEIN